MVVYQIHLHLHNIRDQIVKEEILKEEEMILDKKISVDPVSKEKEAEVEKKVILNQEIL